MSQGDGQDATDDPIWARRLQLARSYHVPVLAVLVAFMLWVRLQAYENFLVDGQVYYSGNDAYYHFREVMYTVNHWPWTMPFDPWTYFPYGTAQGQFGTLFDQLIATAALIVGLGNPSEHTVAIVHMIAPAVFGTATAIPVYAIGARIDGRVTGLLAAAVLAILPSTFLSRTTVGFTDHNAAEPLFQAIAILALLVAIQVVEREKPVFELIMDRDFAGLQQSVGWSAVAGVALFVYIWVWPPALFLIGLLGLFYTIALAYDFVSGRSPEHVAMTGVVVMAVVFVLSMLRIDRFTMDTTAVSLLHLLLAMGVGLGCVFMAVLARVWERRELPTWGYPSTVTVLIAIGAGLTSVVLPSAFSTVRTNVMRIFAFGQTATTLTVREAQPVPFDSLVPFLIGQYGFAFVTAIAGLLWLYLRFRRRDDYSATSILVMVWAVPTMMMALTQVRFHYYLTVVIAILTAYFLARLLDLLDLRSLEDFRRIETYQVITLLAVLLVVVAPLTPLFAGPGVVGTAKATGPGASVTWGEGLDWLEQNTPAEGTFGATDNEMAYYGTYEKTDDFDYPDGAYGVMSWWDYGHWITVMGERIPYANPFQQNPQPASAFLQTTNETHANLITEALPSLAERPGSAATMSTQELRDVVAGQSDQATNEEGRFVAIDDQMAGGKFSAITQWAGPGTQTYFQSRQYQLQGRNVSLPTTTERYDETMLGRLYYQDASGLEHYRLVHEVDQYAIVGGFVDGQRVRSLVSLPLSGGWDRAGPIAGQIARARGGLVSLGQGTNQYVYSASIESRVKLYERVEGATLSGTVSAPANTSVDLNGTPVIAYVRLQTHTGRNFTYIQQTHTGPDGSFEMTVPYATDDSVSVTEGGTNSSVTALGEYQIQAGSTFAPLAGGTVAVPESAVYEGREIQVDLEPVQRENESMADNTSETSADLSFEEGFDDTSNDVVMPDTPTTAIPLATRPEA